MQTKIVRNPKEFLNIISDIHPDLIIVMPHEIPDLDSYASAYALKELLSDIGFRCNVFLQKPSQELKNIASSLGFPLFESDKEIIEKEVSRYAHNLLILVDFADPSRILDSENKKILNKISLKFAIDHHIADISPEIHAALIIDYPSSSEILVDMLISADKENLLDKNPTLANALMAGILHDTGFLLNAKKHTFQPMTILIDIGDY